MTLRKIPLTFLILVLGTTCAYAKKQPKYEQSRALTPEQAALVQRAVGREKVLIKAIQQRTPLVETYIQDTRPDVKLYEVPVDDQYMLSRVDFGKGFFDKQYTPRAAAKKSWFKGSFGAISGLTKALGLEKFTYSPTGFMQMMFVDPTGFDQQHYVFSYVRREFLGSVRTWVFDVHPKTDVKGMGRFYGRIWIEDQDGNVVRFNGTYTGPTSEDSSKYYFHFDSWRMNVQPGVWAPAAVYIEDTLRDPVAHAQSFKGQTTYWGYSLKLPTRESDAESMEIENAQDQSDNSADVSPLQAEREWISQAEQNVLDRLTQAGLVAPPSDFDKGLEQVTTNIVIGNNLQLPSDIHCRVILTTPLESLAIGNTILLSKGLVDTLPDEPALAAVISFQLAHIVTGHHIDTRYAFNDRLLFPDTATFRRITMNHSTPDDEEAAKKAVDLFNHSIYHDKASSVGLFFQQLEARQKALPALFTPRLGDSLMRADGQPWLMGLTQGAPKLDMDNLTQIAALPLNSRLKIDPWDDKVFTLNVKPAPLLNARDKMPLELTPVYYRLQRYQEGVPAGTPANATPPANVPSPPSADAGGQQPSASAQAQPQAPQ